MIAAPAAAAAIGDRPLRLAMFAPAPPAPTGVADYVRDLLDALPAAWSVDVFDESGAAAGHRLGRARVHPFGAWQGLADAEPYDLNVHHVGNGPHHAETLAHALRHPGLLVLHDAVLHPSRLERGLAAYDLRGYRAEAEACRPDVGRTLGHLVAGGVTSPLLAWTFPLCDDVVRASRHTVVHGPLLARWLRAVAGHGRIGSVAHWRRLPECAPDRIEAWRERLGATDTRVLLGTFGHLGAAHRVDLILDAVADLGARDDFAVVVVGSAGERLRAVARGHVAGDRVHFTGRVDEADFGALVRAVDVGLNLRYPSARAASGPLTQLMQAGVPCIVHDLLHLRDLPSAAVRRVPTGNPEHERRQLGAAVRGWLHDAAARRHAGAAAAAWSAGHASREAMDHSYRVAVATALAGA